MKKTAAEWFANSLPPHLAAAAIRNLTECPDLRAKSEFSTLSSALICSFVWSNSAEGTKFWSSVYDKVEALEKLRIPNPAANRKALAIYEYLNNQGLALSTDMLASMEDIIARED